MKLQTIVSIEKSSVPIDYGSRILLLGSCFVENIGRKLEYFKFQTTQNPFGILFHPLAIENLVERAVTNQIYKKEEIFEHAGIWHCFDTHSDVSAESENELLEKLNQGLEKTREALENATHIIITLGTAWVYRNNETKKIVANCHKVPQREFSKELLIVEKIRSSLEKMINLITSVNQKTQIVFTISPVRHLKDGFVENQRSKAHLISSVYKTTSNFVPLTSYFPSYEIMMDELRDYRFYGKDMVHPNNLAIDYIWEKFTSTWISPKSCPIMVEVDQLQKGLLHRPFNPNSEEHQKFKTSLETKIERFQEKYPFIKFR
ncbi:GSCFA domain-containing protein [Flagellimonas onchidii]|uniref:GSCFA domain-containing protein n=1 Tax=Flagellimonas onchidii TaxID=2562684 RepID=UPI0010A5DECC|nr:GSCFA domain-containing protein [Allomuricauda onchidii]